MSLGFGSSPSVVMTEIQISPLTCKGRPLQPGLQSQMQNQLPFAAQISSYSSLNDVQNSSGPNRLRDLHNDVQSPRSTPHEGSLQKALKRKQANRDAAARSKLKKKQEMAELAVRRQELAETNKALVQKILESQNRLQLLQTTNVNLKGLYEEMKLKAGQA